MLNGLRSHGFRGSALFGLAVLFLLAASVWQSHELGQSRTMYENPIYRWRESMVIALSRMHMHEKPARRYIGYRSVLEHFGKHGLALMDGEGAQPLPTRQQRNAVIYDAPRLETLLQEAVRVPIDQSKPPVLLKGNELGTIDYYYWAFKLFGINLYAPWLFYFLLLSVSVAVFFVSFRRSALSILLLMLYLVVHFALIGYANFWHFGTVHNSRFLPAMSVLPAMHLMLLLLQRRPPTLPLVLGAALQAFMIAFVVFCRMEAIWQPLAVIAAGMSLLPLPRLLRALPDPRLIAQQLARAAIMAWPASLLLVALVGLSLHTWLAPDKLYAKQTKTHVFWHAIYSSTVSASPELSALYLKGEDKHGDAVSYMAVLADLRARGDTSSGITYVYNGMIQIDMMRNMAIYDRLVRRIYFNLIRDHPWLVLKSFLYDKPRDQAVMLWYAGLHWRVPYLLMLILALVAVMVAIAIDTHRSISEQLRASMLALKVILPFSLLTTIISPSTSIVGSIVVWMILLLLALVYLPAAAVWRRVRSAE